MPALLPRLAAWCVHVAAPAVAHWTAEARAANVALGDEQNDATSTSADQQPAKESEGRASKDGKAATKRSKAVAPDATAAAATATLRLRALSARRVLVFGVRCVADALALDMRVPQPATTTTGTTGAGASTSSGQLVQAVADALGDTMRALRGPPTNATSHAHAQAQTQAETDGDADGAFAVELTLAVAAALVHVAAADRPSAPSSEVRACVVLCCQLSLSLSAGRVCVCGANVCPIDTSQFNLLVPILECTKCVCALGIWFCGRAILRAQVHTLVDVLLTAAPARALTHAHLLTALTATLSAHTDANASAPKRQALDALVGRCVFHAVCVDFGRSLTCANCGGVLMWGN